MKRRTMTAASVAAYLALCASSQLAVGAEAQQSFDKRNFTGTWDRYPIPGATVDPTVRPRAPDTSPPPLKPEYKAKYEAEQKAIADANARGEPPATGYTHCIPDGMPAMMQGMFPMEVLQTPGQITIIQEAYNQVRRIYLDQKQLPIEDAEPGFAGHSVARWEGDVLVVDTVGIKDRVRFRNVPHSNQVRISERIKVLSADMFENQITITDPVYLTGPWTWTWQYKRRPNYKMYEYVCEDNREYADPETGVTRLRVTKPKQK
jgi:hypothetical protein